MIGKVPAGPLKPEIKTEEQIDGVWNACKFARYVLDHVSKFVKVLYMFVQYINNL